MAEPLRQLGISMTSNNGFPPLKIKGPLKPTTIYLDGSLSSQFLSGLLIALPLANGDSLIKVSNLMSIPYVEMTIKAIESFGGKIENHDFKEFFIKGNQTYSAGNYLIEGDWSGAAGLLVAGAIGGNIHVELLQSASSQADYAVIDAITQTGALITSDKDNWIVTKQEKLSAFEFDALHCPDLFPVLTALAANCQGTSSIKGVHRLIHKESNRGEALKKEFNKLGIHIDFEADIMYITGGNIKGGRVFAHNDHRIAMALTLAALNASEPVMLEGAECVNKTYPEFYTDMLSLGVNMDSIN